jgi:hypothetical protein
MKMNRVGAAVGEYSIIDPLRPALKTGKISGAKLGMNLGIMEIPA